MAETTMMVDLIGHTQCSETYLERLTQEIYPEIRDADIIDDYMATDGQIISLTAIRTCYSHLKPIDIVSTEFQTYFCKEATDGGSGTDADRLLRQIVASKHTSTLEHLSYTFAISGISRACLAQLTRHRVGFSFSVQSQRYVKFGLDNKSEGFDWVVPDKIAANPDAKVTFEYAMLDAQDAYDRLRKLGMPSEDARAVLPNAASTNLVMTVNLRAALEFYAKRRPGNGAQSEIARLSVAIRDGIVAVEPWTKQFFDKLDA